MPSFTEEIFNHHDQITILDTLLSYYDDEDLESSLTKKKEYDDDFYEDEEAPDYEQENAELLAELKEIKRLMKETETYSLYALFQHCKNENKSLDEYEEYEPYTALENISKKLMNDNDGILDDSEYIDYLKTARLNIPLEHVNDFNRFSQLILNMAQSENIDDSDNSLVGDQASAVSALRSLLNKLGKDFDDFDKTELTNLVFGYPEMDLDSETTQLAEQFSDCYFNNYFPLNDYEKNDLDSIVEKIDQTFTEQLIGNKEHLELLNVFLSIDPDDLTAKLDNDSEQYIDQKYDPQNKLLLEQLQELHTLMDETKTECFSELVAHCMDAEDDDVLINRLNGISSKILENDEVLLNDSEYVTYLQTNVFEDDIEAVLRSENFYQNCQ